MRRTESESVKTSWWKNDQPTVKKNIKGDKFKKQGHFTIPDDPIKKWNFQLLVLFLLAEFILETAGETGTNKNHFICRAYLVLDIDRVGSEKLVSVTRLNVN